MKPRFSLHELFLAMTLLAVGIVGITILARAGEEQELLHVVAPAIYFGSGIAIGVALGVPFQHKTTGGVLGFVLAVLFLSGLATYESWVAAHQTGGVF